MAYQNYNNQRQQQYQQQNDQQQEQSASFPLGGDGKSSMYAVDKPNKKCIASGIFNVDATIAQLRAAASHPENTRPGHVSIKVFRTGKAGILFASCYPVRAMQTGGRGFGGGQWQGGGQRFNWNQQQQQPSYAPQNRNNFQQQYEQQGGYDDQDQAPPFDADDVPAQSSRAQSAPRTKAATKAAPAKKAATRRK